MPGYKFVLLPASSPLSLPPAWPPSPHPSSLRLFPYARIICAPPCPYLSKIQSQSFLPGLGSSVSWCRLLIASLSAVSSCSLHKLPGPSVCCAVSSFSHPSFSKKSLYPSREDKHILLPDIGRGVGLQRWLLTAPRSGKKADH